MTNKNKACFYEVTPQDIMNKLEAIEVKLGKRHTQIKVNTWLGSVSITLYLGVLSLLLLR